jgi:hypothetical protein
LDGPVLDQFSFALMSALEKHIETIRKLSEKKKRA